METYYETIDAIWRKKWQPTPVFLLGKSPEQRSRAGYSPWIAELDKKEQLTTHTHTLTHTQCPYLTHLEKLSQIKQNINRNLKLGQSEFKGRLLPAKFQENKTIQMHRNIYLCIHVL